MDLSRMLRLDPTLDVTGKSRSGLYEDIAAGLMTRGVKLGKRAVGWPAHEVKTIVRARVAGKSDSELRSLVDRLHAQRVAGEL
jgi:prophage regulatory protein